MTISGITEKFGKNERGAYVDLMNNVRCYFPEKDVSSLSSLSRGQSVLITGHVSGISRLSDEQRTVINVLGCTLNNR